MGTFIIIVICVIIGFAIIGFLFSKDGEKEDGAKTGAILGVSLITSLLPTIIGIALIVFFVKACT